MQPDRFQKFAEQVRKDALKGSDILAELSDENLIEASFDSALTRIKSAKDTKAKRFRVLCDKYDLPLEVGADFLCNGSSGKIGNDRGNALNKIVRDLLDSHPFVKKAETEVKYPRVSEIVDVLATLEDGTRFVIMCQVGLWEGGAQANRGDKYVVDPKFKDICETNGDRWGCVVLNPPTFKTMKSKQFNIFRSGYEQKTLFYPTVLLQYLDDLGVAYGKNPK